MLHPAVGHRQPQIERGDVPAAHRGIERGDGGIAVVRMDAGDDALEGAGKPIAADFENPIGLVRPENLGGQQIHLPASQLGHGLRGDQPLPLAPKLRRQGPLLAFGFLQALLGQHPRGDVDMGDERAAAIFHGDRGHARPEPAQSARRTARIFQFEQGRLAAEHGPDAGGHLEGFIGTLAPRIFADGEVVGPDTGSAGARGASVAGLAPGRVDGFDPPIRIQQGGRRRQGVEKPLADVLFGRWPLARPVAVRNQPLRHGANRLCPSRAAARADCAPRVLP